MSGDCSNTASSIHKCKVEPAVIIPGIGKNESASLLLVLLLIISSILISSLIMSCLWLQPSGFLDLVRSIGETLSANGKYEVCTHAENT